MLESMAGLRTGVRDALTRYTRPITGSYYFVPASESLRPVLAGKFVRCKVEFPMLKTAVGRKIGE
jgi:deferrochelatase/peroxidase EfeB